MIYLTDDDVAALRRVIDYNWADEQRDYAEQDDDGRAHHVFRDLSRLSRLVKHDQEALPVYVVVPMDAVAPRVFEDAEQAERYAEMIGASEVGAASVIPEDEGEAFIEQEREYIG